MHVQSSAWAKYQDTLRQFEAVLEHAKAVSSSLVGITTTSANATYGEQLFVSMLAQCTTLRRIAPDPRRKTANELWDLTSMYAIARCIIEAHDSYVYVAATSVPELERDFRVYLWELHDKTRRLKMLELIGSTRPEVETIREERDILKAKIVAHSMFGSTGGNFKKKIQDNDPPAMHLSQAEFCSSNGVSLDFYNAVTIQLSQYVHSFPFALHQLLSFQAGSDQALSMVGLPLEYVIPFLGRVASDMRVQYPGRTPEAPARTAKAMALWEVAYARGVKSAA